MVAAYYGISGYVAGMDAERENWRIWTTLRCGARFLGQDMSSYTNEAGLIDIGRAGCSDGRFLAKFDEIREAAARPTPPEEWRGFGEVFQSKL